MITIPTISQLYTQVLTDLETSYGTSTPSFGKNFLRAIAGVQAAKLWLLYKLLGSIQKNTFVDTADPEASGGSLERWGRIKLGRNPFPAQAGQYVVQVTGTPGATISAKTTFKSNDDSANPGKLFVLDTVHVMISGSDSITLRALVAGADSRLAISDNLTSTAPISGVNKTATVQSETTTPTDAEDLEIYRQKVLDAFRLEPEGGANADYKIWSADAAGVANAYPYPAPGQENEVNLYIEATKVDSTDGKGTPGAGIISDVEDVIELDPDDTKDILDRGRRPTNVIVNVLPVSPQDLEIDIADYADIDADKQALILAALTELIDSIRPYIAGADVLADRNDRLDKNIVISKIQEAVPGSDFGVITITVDGTPQTSYTFTDGEIPFLDDVTYS